MKPEETLCLGKVEPSQPAKEWVILQTFPQGKWQEDLLSTDPFSFSLGKAAGGPWRGGGAAGGSGIKMLQAWPLSYPSLTGK